MGCLNFEATHLFYILNSQKIKYTVCFKRIRGEGIESFNWEVD